MKALTAAVALATLLAGVMPTAAGPWWWRPGPYAYGPRFHPWAWGPRRFVYRRYYGGFGGGYGGYGGGGRQTMTGGPSGGRPGGS